MQKVGANSWRVELRKHSRALAKEALKLTGNDVFRARISIMNAVEFLHEMEKNGGKGDGNKPAESKVNKKG